MLLLEVDNLYCAIRRGTLASFTPKWKPVLCGVSLSIEQGSSVALLGGSGGGKTTLARCIAGLQQPDSGRITVEGVNVFPAITNRKRVGVRIQMLFQGVSASLDPTMTVLDCLTEGITARAGEPSKQDVREEAERLVLSVGMRTECLGRFPHQLSGGQRQRIAFARVLAVAPRLLILDEPTSALDVLTSAQLMQVLKSAQMSEGFSILYITHDVRTALSVCDRVAVLHNGVIVEEGPGGELLKHPKHRYTHQLLRDSRIV